MASPAPNTLHASGIRKHYGQAVALDGVSLDAGSGECVALVGESGSGKTTLLRCFNAMVVPDAGTVRVGDVDVRDADPIRLRREIGYVQQEGGLMPHWSVLRNAAMVPWLRDLAGAPEKAARALEQVGLPAAEYGDRWPRELSGGQRQRVAIARALAGDPQIVLLDEPFGALDAITRTELQSSFHALRKRLGLTVVLVTHDLREAQALADRVAVMRQGKIEQTAPFDELAASPATPYVRELLARAGMAAA